MTVKLLAPLFALGLLLSTVAAQPAPKPVDDKALVTKVYSVKHLVGERGKAGGIADADAIIKVIFEALPELRDLKADGPQIVERDGGKLEIRTTAKTHGEVKDLLDALERLQDLAIDVKATVYELDVTTYEKFAKALPKGKTKPPVLFAAGDETEGKEGPAIEKSLAEANKLLKTGRLVQTSGSRFVNGAEATLAARQTVVTYRTQTGNEKSVEPPQFVKEGFKLVGTPVVSRDRRFVRFKLTEQSLAVTGMKKVDLGEVIDKQRLVLQTLQTEDLGATGSAEVADGSTLIFKLTYAPKDKVWVVLLETRIFIQAEQDELKKEEKRLEDKVKRVFPSDDLVKPIKP